VKLVAATDGLLTVNTCIFSVIIAIPGRRSIRCVHKSDVCPSGGFNKMEDERLEKKSRKFKKYYCKILKNFLKKGFLLHCCTDSACPMLSQLL
jgi:hypothetical protein